MATKIAIAEPVEVEITSEQRSDGFRPVGSTPVVVIRKQGHSCCGCCCDSRRAVIICDIILIIFGIIALLFEGLGVGLSQAVSNASFDDDVFDDETKQETQDAAKDAESLFLMTMVLTSVGIASSALAIYGALKFDWRFVAPNAVVLVTRAVAPIFMGSFSLLTVVIAGLWTYPHVVFCLEARNGIMSKQKYRHEEQSCCCVRERVFVGSPEETAVVDGEMA